MRKVYFFDAKKEICVTLGEEHKSVYLTVTESYMIQINNFTNPKSGLSKNGWFIIEDDETLTYFVNSTVSLVSELGENGSNKILLHFKPEEVYSFNKI